MFLAVSLARATILSLRARPARTELHRASFCAPDDYNIFYVTGTFVNDANVTTVGCSDLPAIIDSHQSANSRHEALDGNWPLSDFSAIPTEAIISGLSSTTRIFF